MVQHRGYEMTQNRDYTLIIDKSGSMAKMDDVGGKSRWKQMKESTLALAIKCESFTVEDMENIY